MNGVGRQDLLPAVPLQNRGGSIRCHDEGHPIFAGMGGWTEPNCESRDFYKGNGADTLTWDGPRRDVLALDRVTTSEGVAGVAREHAETVLLSA